MAGELLGLRQSTIYFAPPGSTAVPQVDVNFSVAGLGAGSGWQSDFLDLGHPLIPRWWEWKAWARYVSAPTVADDHIRVHLKTLGTSDSATDFPDNSDDENDGAIADEDQTRNLRPLGTIIADKAAGGTHMATSNKIHLLARSVQVVFFNASGVALSSNVNELGFWMTPTPTQQQP